MAAADPSTGHEPDTYMALAIELAREAGALVTTLAAEARANPETKSSGSDLVTLADKQAEALIVDGLLTARPDDGIEGEEGASHAGSSGVVWHIDPIDGTTNYVYAIPAFSVSIAAAVDDQVVAGVVFDPVGDRLYRATIGGGAFCNDQPIACTALDATATALVATGFSYNAARRRHQAGVVGSIISEIRDIRRFGSAALDLCAVATGQVDAYYELGLNRWDLAAGALIAAEAGALVANLDGGPPDSSFVLAANPTLFDQLAPMLRAAGATDPV
ncbi:MAG: inositol monophosphatase family protein [Actinomycetota bacterium]